MSKNDTGVFQLDNGYWGYRYAIRIDGKSRESKKVKDEFGNPFKTKSSAAKARQQAIMNEKINAATPQVKRPRKKVSEVYNEYCEFGRAGKAYSTIKKQDSLWNNHIKSKFGKRYVDDISVAEINDYLAELYYIENRAYSYTESFLKIFYLIFGQAYSRNYLNAEQYDKLCKNKDTKIHMPIMKIDEDTDIVTSSDEQMITLSEYFTEIAFLGKPLTKPIVKPLGLFFCIFLERMVQFMCYFQSQAVGHYCACCRNCSDYLSTCVPIVVYGGYAVGECDFDFCSYCPCYSDCEEIWGKAVDL